MPDNFYDNYEGRLAAQKQQMNIEKDMNLVYDLKMYDPDVHTNNKELEEWGFNNYHRMSPSQRQQWDRHYKPIIAKFKRDSLSGRALAEWKYQRYMHDYCRVITSIDQRGIDALCNDTQTVSLDYRVGDYVHTMRNGTDRIGQLTICTSEVGDAERLAQDALSCVRIETADSEQA